MIKTIYEFSTSLQLLGLMCLITSGVVQPKGISTYRKTGTLNVITNTELFSLFRFMKYALDSSL